MDNPRTIKGARMYPLDIEGKVPLTVLLRDSDTEQVVKTYRIPVEDAKQAQSKQEFLDMILTKKTHLDLEVEGEIFKIAREDVELRMKAKEGYAAAAGKHAVVILDTRLTPELVRSGYARHLNRFIQDARKNIKLNHVDRIHVWVESPCEEVNKAIEEHKHYLCDSTLAVSITLAANNMQEPVEPELTLGEQPLRLWVVKDRECREWSDDGQFLENEDLTKMPEGVDNILTKKEQECSKD